MSVEDPRPGAFSYYATRYWFKRAGFVSSWSYRFNIGDGFIPHGLIAHSANGQWTGLLMALCVVMFSFGGTELIGITT